MPRLSVIVLPIFLAVAAWGAMSLASKLNMGFQFTPEQIVQHNRLQDCRVYEFGVNDTKNTRFIPAEDVEVDLETDTAWFGVTDIRSMVLDKPSDFDGNFVAWSLDTDTKTVPLRVTKAGKPVEEKKMQLNPIGVSILRYQGFRENPGLWLFAVNADRTRDGPPQRQVIIYNYDRKPDSEPRLIQEYVVKNALFETVNDVAAISPTEFYATNDHTGPGSTGPFGVVLDLLGMPTGNVVYCNAETSRCRVVADGLSFANGVYLNHDHTKLYVTETSTRQFLVYDRDITTNEIHLNESIQLDSLLDNINVDMHNNVWVVGTMDAIATMRTINDATGQFHATPNIVYRLVPKKSPHEAPTAWSHPGLVSNNFWIEIVYADNGSPVAPISTAAPTRLGQVIMTSMVGSAARVCTVPRTP